MNIKASIAAALIGLAAGAGCSSSSTPPTTAAGHVVSTTVTTMASLKWTSDGKAGVRQVVAIAAQGTQLDCAVDVITGIYSPEDWVYALAHPVPDDGKATAEVPQRMVDLDDQAHKLLVSRCGIADTRAADRAKADAMAAWNNAVAEWNKLTDQRDAAGAKTVVVNGQSFEDYKAWAAANGKPLAAPQ